MDEHPELALVAGLTQLLDDAGDPPAFGLTGSDLDRYLEALLVVESRLHARTAAAVEQAAAVDRPAELAAPNMVAWLRGRFLLSPRAAASVVRAAAALEAAPVAAEAARFGAIQIEGAAEIGLALTALPDEVGPALRKEGEDVLLGFAVGRVGPALDPHQLRLAGRRLLEILDPEDADRLAAARLEREDAEVHRRRYLSVVDDPAGGVRVRGLLTAESGANLRAVLGPLSAPRPAGPPGPPEPTTAVDETGEVGASGNGAADQERDDRTGGQRQADALGEAMERLLAVGDLPTEGGNRPQLIVTVDHASLLRQLPVGVSADGTELSPAVVRRLACDAGILPAVLGTASRVLDLGRSARTATGFQRRALGLRDGGCAFPGCDRPAAWCQAHHIQRWSDLGPTDLTNLVLLCGSHHRDVHHRGWEIMPPTDGSRPLFVPPAWIDPRRRPRRNLLHHLRHVLRGPP